MHRLKSTWGRSLPAVAMALAAAAVLAIIVATNLGSGTSSVSATNPTATGTIVGPTPTTKPPLDLTGVSCADIFLEQNPLSALGSPPGAEDLPVASALSRTEASATPSLWDVTTVAYQGPDLVTGDELFIFDAVPDTGPTINTCAVSRTNGQNGKEQEKMHQRTAFASQFGNRPTAHANIIVGTFDPSNSEDGAGANTCYDTGLVGNPDNGGDGLIDTGDPDCYDPGGTTYVHFTTCTFSEVLSVWQRTESTNVITDKSTKPINYGRVTLYVGSRPPTSGPAPGKNNEALDPNTCSTAGSLPFANVTVLYSRDATTDKPALLGNPAAIAAGKLQVDPDGCNPNNGSVLNKPTPTPVRSAVCNPKPKDGQDKDGWNEQYVGPFAGKPFLADDWDGDGCPDWDELDHTFVHSFTNPNSTNQNGMDPFNPNDCDKLFTGNFVLFVTASHDTGACSLGQLVTEGSAIGACGPGLAIENGAQCNPGNTVDDDNDGSINDGCPAVGAPEAGLACAPGDTTDNEPDGTVNDGCPGITPNGQFFQCLAKVTQTISGGNTDPVAFVAGCYSDSTVQVVNAAYFAETGGQCTNMTNDDPAQDILVNDGCPKVNATSEGDIANACTNSANDDSGDDIVVNDGCPAKPDTCPAPAAAQDNCGDGRAGPRPPGGSTRNSGQAFLNIDDDTYPVSFSGTYDHTTNRLTFNICLQNGGPFFGPVVAANGDIDAHTGAGTMDLHGTLQTMADCLDGMPYTTQVTTALDITGAEVELTERGTNIDSDHDGCTDNAELGSSVGAGGKRDLFNKWDYFNPALNNANSSADITAVVNHYGHPPGDPLYKERYDRGPIVPGSHPWNFRPPNGNINSADITAAVNSYGHNCNAKTPPPFTS